MLTYAIVVNIIAPNVPPTYLRSKYIISFVSSKATADIICPVRANIIHPKGVALWVADPLRP